MFKTIVQHMKDVEHAIKEMNTNAAFAFALACTERQWPIFHRASDGRPWIQSGPSNLRYGIDITWKHLINGISLPPGFVAACRREVPQAEDIVDAPSSAAHTIANSIVDLLDAIEKGDALFSHHLSGRNLGLLEMLADEFTERGMDDGQEATKIRELIDQEIQHQNRDLQDLSKDSSSSNIEEERRASAGKSLFGKLWFP